MIKRKRLIQIGIGALVLLLLGAGLLLLALQRLQSDPIPIGEPSNTLAFISDREGKWDIYLLDPTGTLTNLTAPGDYHDYFASWSFDGNRINFITTRHGEELGPGQVQPDGTDLRTLSIAQAITTIFFEGRVDWHPTWTPDGQRIAWVSLRDLNLEIYSGTADGSRFTRLTQHPARDWFPKASPDGAYIAFSSDREGNEDVYKIPFEGGDLIRLTDSGWDDLQPMWSLDGQHILYISDEEDALLRGEIIFYMMDAADGGNKRPLEAGEVFRGDAVYTADGGQMAYMSNEDGYWHIYMMDADGGNIVRLTQGEANYLFPVWRPQSAQPPADDPQNDQDES